MRKSTSCWRCARGSDPDVAVIADEPAYAALRDGLRARGLRTERAGRRGRPGARLRPTAARDTVIAAIVGAAGLSSTLAAARAGKRLLLANKESVVLAGAAADAHGAGARRRHAPADRQRAQRHLPVPASRCEAAAGVRRMLLTASGGPFRGRSRATLADGHARRRRARIRTGSMGRKISVDSATLMNKGLEVIEAHHLFGAARRQHRGGGASAERGPFPGRLRRRLGAGAAGQPGHAHRARLRPGLAGADRLRRRAAGPAAHWRASISKRRTSSLSLPGASPTPRLRPAAARRPCSMPPMKSPFQPFFRAGCRFPGIPDLIEATPGRACRLTLPTILDVLTADRRRAQAPPQGRRQLSTEDGTRMSDFLGSVWWLHRQPGRAGHLPRVRPLLGRAPLRRQGAAVLGRLRQAAVVARGRGRHRVRGRHDPARRLREDARRARRRSRAQRIATRPSTASRWAAHRDRRRRSARQPAAVRRAVLG